MLITCNDTVCFSPPIVGPDPCACCAWSHPSTLSCCSLVCTSVCTVRAQAAAGEKFFNRTHELDCLKRLLSTPPNRTGITVIVGPVSCGKTALVRHYLEQLEQPQPPIYLDCRLHAVSTPDSFASALLSTADKAGGRFREALSAHPSIVIETLKLIEDFFALIGGAKPVKTPFASVLEIFQRTLDQTFQEGCPRPPIIIDYANALTSWSTAHPHELIFLLRSFVRITSQENLTHVLLMTSDYAFVSWLMKEGEHTAFPGPHGCCQVVHNVTSVMTLSGLVCRGEANLSQSESYRRLHTRRSASVLQHSD